MIRKGTIAISQRFQIESDRPAQYSFIRKQLDKKYIVTKLHYFGPSDTPVLLTIPKMSYEDK